MNSDTDIRKADDFFLMSNANRISREIARDWPGIEAGDIEGEILADICKRRDQWEKCSPHIACVRMREIGVQYAGKERATNLFFDADWTYTPAEVRKILEESYYNEDAWLQAPQKDKDPVNLEAGSVFINLMDMQAAMDSLPDYDRQVIESRFRDGGMSSPAERKAVQRAVDKLVQRLNNATLRRQQERDGHEGPGSRRAMSNAEARRLTTSYTD